VFSSYTTTKVRLITHDAHGLTHKDFELALAIDQLVANEFANFLKKN
jgi:pterin-4a-carbinolamine dehydratase